MEYPQAFSISWHESISGASSTLAWGSLHHWLITEVARSLTPQLRLHYYIAVEERVYELTGDDAVLVGIPDDGVVGNATTNW